MKITYLGHSCFEININQKKILIDPFLVASPDYNFSDVTDIFVTHGHGDHLGSAIEISKATGAKITAIFELANYCALKGANVFGMNLGAWVDYEWGKVIAVSALHSSSTPDGVYAGCPCGFIFEVENKRIYHAGDTSLSSEMELIGKLYSPQISLLPVGGVYTMDIDQAIIAYEMLKSNVVIPMHYNTFDAIKVDIVDFENKIIKKGGKPIVLNIGQSHE